MSFVELVLCVLGVLQKMHGVIACVVWRLVYVRGCVERFTSVKFMCGQLLRAYYDTVPPLDTVAAFGTLQIDVPKRISQY